MLIASLCLLAFQDWSFTDVTAAAGVSWNHSYVGSTDFQFIAAGAAAADIDLDGWPDLYVLGGDGQGNALFRNLGDGRFQNITASAGVSAPGRFNCGAAFADVDGDGYPDLLVGGISASPILYRNKGDGSFEDVTATAGLSLAGSTFSAAFADTDRDGDLDLFLSHWQTGDDNFFFTNDGTGHFTNATAAAGFGDAFRPDLSFTPNFADFDGDHWPDLVVASDLGHSRVFINDRAGHFRDLTDAVITDENGMGAAVGDYDNDGHLDWFVSSVGQAFGKTAKGVTGNRLYRGLGNCHFEDVTSASGVREGGWGWGSSMADFDNDGWLDIFHTNGFLGPFAPGYGADPSRFFHNRGDGSFTERAAALGLADQLQGRGVVCFDYDRDGDLDLFVAYNGSPGRLLRNDGAHGHWLALTLHGNRRNSAAVGTRVTVKAGSLTLTRELCAGNNFVSSNPLVLHFGLGSASVVDLTLQWPDGTSESHEQVAVDQFLNFTEPAEAAHCGSAQRRWLPHLARADGSFKTLVTAANFGTETGILDLVGYDAQGSSLGAASLVLAPGEKAELETAALFGALEVSHLAIYAPDRLVVTASYRLAAGASAAAQAHEMRQTDTQFAVYLGDPSLVYDGMALINPGEQPLEVRAELLEQGNVVASRILASALPPNAKLLAVFNDLFQARENQTVRIVCDREALAFFLRGTLAGIQPGLLFQVAPVPVPQ